jgi:hypothetical protein
MLWSSPAPTTPYHSPKISPNHITCKGATRQTLFCLTQPQSTINTPSNLSFRSSNNQLKQTLPIPLPLHFRVLHQVGVLSQKLVQGFWAVAELSISLKASIRWVLRFLTLVYVLETRKPQIW